MDLIKRIYVECNNCGAILLKIHEKYCLVEIRDMNYTNWERYHHQTLTVREWNTIAQGGISDSEQRRINLRPSNKK